MKNIRNQRTLHFTIMLVGALLAAFLLSAAHTQGIVRTDSKSGNFQAKSQDRSDTSLAQYGRASAREARRTGKPVTESALDRDKLEQRGSNDHLLLLKAGSIDTSISRAWPESSTTAAGYGLHLIQFGGPVEDAWLAAVEATGAQAVHYIANYGYLLWADGPARSQLDVLAANSDFLTFSAPYSTTLKSDESLAKVGSGLQQEIAIEVTIQILQHDDDYITKQILDEIVVQKQSNWEPVLNYQNFRAVISSSSVAAIKNLPDVVWIEPYQVPELTDEIQAQILAGNLDEGLTMPSGPGYLEWLTVRGFSSDPQKYPIIDITDDGIGTGIAKSAAGDQTMRVAGIPAGDSRIAYLTNCSNAADAGGPDGHGHINASIAAGHDARSGEPYRDAQGYQRGLGLNPFGRLAGSRVFDEVSFDLSNCGNSYLSLLRKSYQSGARIVNNSWGCSSAICINNYTVAAQNYDTAVRDADASAEGNQELLILFSAGNSGERSTDELGTIGSPANAKNVLTVGASENVRPAWTDGCGFGAEDADNLQDIADYSSRGPTPGGRTKPDLVAPGTHIIGTASTNQFYSGAFVCDPYHPQNQKIFASSTGTSHSVPAVAGIASLASYWLNEHHEIANPSPALIKAFLVATSSYLNGKGANDDLPSNNQGFGIPNLSSAFSDTQRIIIEQGQQPQFSASGQSWSINVRAVDNDLPLRVVLAFTDQPGAVPSADPRVNDLDLEVRQNGMTYRGNEMDGQWSQPGGEADMANNIEAVFLPPGEKVSLVVAVKAANIGGDGVPGNNDNTDQDFVLVCDNCELETIVKHDYLIYEPLLVP